MEKRVKLTSRQKELLKDDPHALLLTEQQIVELAAMDLDLAELPKEQLLEFLRIANLLYRGGQPLIDDSRYDFVFLSELRKRDPDHPFLQAVEPEPALGAKTVALPFPMLSTEKAYDFNTMQRWAKRIKKAAVELGRNFEVLVFKATPKLDGYAAYDDGNRLYTRGDGRRGTDITRAFERGLQVARGGDRGLGAGEVVVSKSYFASHLSKFFDNSRNFQASLIKEKELEPPAAEAIERGEAVFYPFSLLPSHEAGWKEIAENFEAVVDSLWQQVDYDIDGIVFEVTDQSIKEHMGSTRHHHRWQIAYKRNTQTADVRVTGLIAQTSRSGRVNPVAEIEPTRLSGALIQRATAHHFNMVREKGIGPGALIRLSRSGEVIPKIEAVLEAVTPVLPDSCPSCGSGLIWEGDYLNCVNVLDCPAQITNSIEHFFRVLGNIDGFGPASISRLYKGGVDSISGIYQLQKDDFTALGFGDKQAENMVAQLSRSLSEPIEDWRFLAAFGVHRLAMGNCEKLLSCYPLAKVFSLRKADITGVKGFSDKIAEAILPGLAAIREEFDNLYALGFAITATPVSDTDIDQGPQVLDGKLLVFSGTMNHGSREDMKKQARALGAKVGSSITGKTDLLICGEKIGVSKLNRAKELGVQRVTEAEYLAMIEGREK
jgi:DNA ligase (NAD+)